MLEADKYDTNRIKASNFTPRTHQTRERTKDEKRQDSI